MSPWRIVRWRRPWTATGRIDGLVCNAGIGAVAGPVHRHHDAAFELVLRTHLHHTAIWARAAWPHLRAAEGGGAIVTTSSATAMGLAGSWDYAAAKGAIWSLTTLGRGRPAPATGCA